MKQPIFTGVCTALVTPFFENKINYPLLEQLLRNQVTSGVNAIVLAGTTGEASTLSDREKIELFKHSKTYVGNACTIIAGTGSNVTSHAVNLSKEAEDAGADALLVVSPYYNKANPQGLIAHYTTIAQNVHIPIIMYNVPSRTGVDIPVSVYQQLSEVPNIVGVKEACGNITKIAEIRSACPDDFYIWSGNDDQIVPVISLGGKGVISVLSNICPQETIAMTYAALAGDFDTAADLQCKLLRLIKLLFCEVNPVPVKYAMRHIGFDCGSCRLPLAPLSDAHKTAIDTYFT